MCPWRDFVQDMPISHLTPQYYTDCKHLGQEYILCFTLFQQSAKSQLHQYRQACVGDVDLITQCLVNEK